MFSLLLSIKHGNQNYTESEHDSTTSSIPGGGGILTPGVYPGNGSAGVVEDGV